MADYEEIGGAEDVRRASGVASPGLPLGVSFP